MRTKIIAFASLLVLVACGGKEPGQTHTVKADVGGAVVYAADTTVRLEGITVTLTDIEGRTRTATTGVSGLWTIENVLPGVYTEVYSGPGYETMSRTFGVDAFGENDVKNIFISRPDVLLLEERLRMTLSAPFGMELKTGDDPTDGFNGVIAVYRPSVDGTITATFSRRLVSGSGQVRLQIFDTPVFGTRTDTATDTTFTIAEASIDAVFASFGGSATDNDPYTFHLILADGITGITPIHGDLEYFNASVRLNATP